MNNQRGEVIVTIMLVFAALGFFALIAGDHKNRSHSEAHTQQEQTETAKK